MSDGDAQGAAAGTSQAHAAEAAVSDTAVCELEARWRKETFPLSMPLSATLGDLKAVLFASTRVPDSRQKMMGLVKGKVPKDDTATLASLGLQEGATYKFTLMGTPDEHLVVDPEDHPDLPDVINDLDWDYTPGKDDHVADNPVFRAKLESRITSTELRVLHAPRPGKKLLVLDLDYTLFDHKSKANHMHELKRPYVDEFLAASYENYDIVVWSQTSWRWLEAKLTELGFLTSPNYHISFVVDKSAMFTVESNVKGNKRQHEVKALELIWRKFPQWSAANTVHVDDLARNFAMNPKSGLKIKAYRNAAFAKNSDRELLFLTQYLRLIASVDDFDELDFGEWHEYLKENAHRLS